MITFPTQAFSYTSKHTVLELSFAHMPHHAEHTETKMAPSHKMLVMVFNFITHNLAIQHLRKFDIHFMVKILEDIWVTDFELHVNQKNLRLPYKLIYYL